MKHRPAFPAPGRYKHGIKLGVVLLLVGFAFFSAQQTVAQIAVTFDALPYQNLSDLPSGNEDAQVKSSATKLEIGMPLFANERTQLSVGLSWERREFGYRGFTDGSPDIDVLHGGELSFTMMHSLNEKWSLLGIATPGLASDLKGDLSVDDFNIQAVVAGIRRYSPRFAFGFGAVYSTRFGKSIPLPVLLFDWNNGGKLSWMTILPVSSELWYAHSERAHYGLIMGVQGNQYQGDPDRYDVDDPQLEHSMVTIGPSARFALPAGMNLQIDSGFVPYHRFEFFDGEDEVGSFDVSSSAFLRVGLRFGG